LSNSVLKRVGVEQPEAVQEQNNVASTIAFNMAEHALQEQNYEAAERFYREAILHNSDHYEVIKVTTLVSLYHNLVYVQSHLALAKLYMSQENLTPAEHELVTVLQTFPSDDNATLMLAELKFHSNDYTNAIAHYRQILSRKPSKLLCKISYSPNSVFRLL